jgi:hypothetical protein
MAESPCAIIIDLGDDPGQWPADPYKFFTDTCAAECNGNRCWHGLHHCHGRCDHCEVMARLAPNRAIEAPQEAPLRYTCRRCFPVLQASMNDCQSCPRHSPIDIGLTEKQLHFYETHMPDAEVNPAPTSGLGHEQKGQQKAYQSWQPAAPKLLPSGLATPLATTLPTPAAATTPDLEDLHDEVARLEEQVRTLQLSLDLQHSEIDSLNEQIRHLLEMHKSLAKDFWVSRVAGGPGHSGRNLLSYTHESNQAQTQSNTRQAPKVAGPPEAAAVDPPPGLSWQPGKTAVAPGTLGFNERCAPRGLTRRPGAAVPASGTTGVATSPLPRKGRPCIIQATRSPWDTPGVCGFGPSPPDC